MAIVLDHFVPNKDIKAAEQSKTCREFACSHCISHFYDVGKMGIEHALLPEQGVVTAGDCIIGADSHTCTYGALGAFSTGVGSTDMAAGMATGTVMNLNPDGSVGSIAAGIYHKGLGSVAERMFRPHVTCVRMTPDKKFIMAADVGVDQIKVYRLNEQNQELVLVDTVPCDLESAPRHFIFSPDGRFMYLMYEVKNVIDVYTYETGNRAPKVEKIQTISTTGKDHVSQLTAACAIRFSSDAKYLFCSNAGDESVSIYTRDEQTGLLEQICCLPVSGEYPKDIAVFPDDKHVASMNHETGTITFFKIDYEKGLLVMCANPVHVDEPNCCVIVKVRD